MKLLMWGVFLATLAVLWGREILAFGAARREKADCKPDERRFRRRTLGLTILLLLGALYELGDVVTLAGPREELLYYGVGFILVIWLLIITARDFRDISENFVQERTQVTLQALVDMERDLARSRRHHDDDCIPLLKFPEDEDDKEDDHGDTGKKEQT